MTYTTKMQNANKTEYIKKKYFKLLAENPNLRKLEKAFGLKVKFD